MPGMSFAASPNLVEQEGIWSIGGTVHVVSQATVLFPRGPYESAQFGFQERLLPFAWAKLDNEGHGILRELGAGGSAGLARTGAGAVSR